VLKTACQKIIEWIYLVTKPPTYYPKMEPVNYWGKLFSTREANYYLDKLLSTIEWKNDEAIIYGKLIITKRKVAWYGDLGLAYTIPKQPR
jgi:hypothetical protein